MEEKSGPQISTILDWTLKLIPFIGTALLFVFTLYSNQSSMIKHDADVDRRLAELERAQNLQDRAMVQRLAMIDAGLLELNHDLQFYLQTKARP